MPSKQLLSVMQDTEVAELGPNQCDQKKIAKYQ